MTFPATPVPRARHLVIKNSVYIISNWTSDHFPNVIYFCIDGFLNGYTGRDSQGLSGPTDRVAAL